MGAITTFIRKWLKAKGYLIIKQNDVALNAITYNEPTSITAFYNNKSDVANYIKNVAIPHAEIMLAHVHKAKINLSHKNVADVGCGTGHFLNVLQQNFETANYTGYEFNETVLQTAKQYFPSINFGVAGMYQKLPLSFDVIFINHVLEHLQYPEDCLKAMSESLNTNGILVINVPNGRLDTFSGHIHFFSEASLSLLISRHLNCKKQHVFLSDDALMICAVIFF